MLRKAIVLGLTAAAFWGNVATAQYSPRQAFDTGVLRSFETQRLTDQLEDQSEDQSVQEPRQGQRQETKQERCERLHNCDTSDRWCRQYRQMVGCGGY